MSESYVVTFVKECEELLKSDGVEELFKVYQKLAEIKPPHVNRLPTDYRNLVCNQIKARFRHRTDLPPLFDFFQAALADDSGVSPTIAVNFIIMMEDVLCGEAEAMDLLQDYKRKFTVKDFNKCE